MRPQFLIGVGPEVRSLHHFRRVHISPTKQQHTNELFNLHQSLAASMGRNSYDKVFPGGGIKLLRVHTKVPTLELWIMFCTLTSIGFPNFRQVHKNATEKLTQVRGKNWIKFCQKCQLPESYCFVFGKLNTSSHAHRNLQVRNPVGKFALSLLKLDQFTHFCPPPPPPRIISTIQRRNFFQILFGSI